MPNPKKIGGDKLWNQRNPFILGSGYDIYNFLSSYTFWGLPCMTVQFDVCISKNVCNDVTVPTKIYLCMDLYTYVYLALNRQFVGSTPTRGELFSRKFWWFQENLQQLKVDAVSRAWLTFRMLISRNKYVYIYMHLCFLGFFISNYTRSHYMADSVL